MKRKSGKYVVSSSTGEEVRAFVPHRLPPGAPVLDLDDDAQRLLREANENLARLNLAGDMVPSLDWFIYAFVRKEAVLSSQIEGTQATLVDLFRYEAEEPSRQEASPDVLEVCNYLSALSYARRELRRKRGLPLSMRLLNGAHKRLMKGPRGRSKQPGAVRRSQNWIGGTRPGNAVYVPPPPDLLGGLLSDLEKYIHGKNRLPALVRAGLIHAQFETLHPYLDGNGRIGRLLVALLLEHGGLLSSPLLYLSIHLKRHREEYYRLLDLVRTQGDWEAWTKFFLEAVAVTAAEAGGTARQLFDLVNADRERLLKLKAATVPSIRVFEMLPRRPMMTIGNITRTLKVTKPTAAKVVDVLTRSKILVEHSGRKRDRVFAYARYLDILSMGTDLAVER
ncbi:MAG: Fic family protein [Deltaproteobacteria bacterium]|nr:Fic family protein [Deltaproteobacteria bacterium]